MAMSLLSVVMALIMMFTGVGSVFSGTDAAQPVSLEIGAGIEGDLSMLAAMAGEDNGSLIRDLVNALSIRAATDASVSQLEILLNGTPAASMAVKSGDEMMEAVSDLFPGVLLTVKKETVDFFAQQAGNDLAASSGSSAGLSADALSEADAVALSSTVISAFTEVTEAFESKYSEPETGSFLFEGVEYTQKQICNVTMQEAVEIVLSAVRKVLSDESAASIVSLAGEDLSPESLDEALESLKETDPDDMPALSMVRYSNEAGDTCHEILMEKDDQKIRLFAAVSGKAVFITADVWMDESDQITGKLLLDQENKTFDVDATVISSGLTAMLKGSFVTGEEESTLSVDITVPFPGTENPMAVHISGRIAHEAPVFAAGEDLETVAMEDLMQDEDAATQFNGKLMIGVMQILAKVAAEFPTVMNLMMPSTPSGSSPVEEEAPAEEIIVVEEAPLGEPPAGEGDAA